MSGLTAAHPMPNHNRKLYVALVTAAVLLAAYTYWALPSFIKYHNDNTQQRENITTYHTETVEQYFDSCIKRDESIANISRCFSQSIDTNRNAQRAQNDLQAQQEMAEWAYALLLLTFASLGVSGIGLVFLFWSLTQTQISISDNREMGEKESRAYLSVRPDGINRLTKRKTKMIGHIIIKNVGNVIAQEVNAAVVMLPVIGKDPNGHDFKLLGIAESNHRKIGSVHPTAEIAMGSPEVIDERDLAREKVKAGDTNIVYIYVYGSVTYKDGFSETTRFTNFCFRYDTDSKVPTKGKIIIPKEIARYHPVGNEAT